MLFWERGTGLEHTYYSLVSFLSLCRRWILVKSYVSTCWDLIRWHYLRQRGVWVSEGEDSFPFFQRMSRLLFKSASFTVWIKAAAYSVEFMNSVLSVIITCNRKYMFLFKLSADNPKYPHIFTSSTLTNLKICVLGIHKCTHFQCGNPEFCE